MAELPASVKVGPYRYAVYLDHARVLAYGSAQAGGRYAGYTKHADLEIAIDPTMPTDQQRETLWHEIKHCVSNLYGQEPAEATHEDHISRMSPMELAVLRDNPDVAAYLLADI